MPLPSQARRSASGGGSMYRRKRRNAPPILVGGVVIVAIAAAVYFLLPKGQRDKVVQPGSAVAQQPAPKPVVPEPVIQEPPKPVVVEKPPAPILEIGQGAAAEKSQRTSPPSPAPQPQKDPAPPVVAKPQPAAPVAPAPKLESGPIDAIASVAAARQKEQAGDLVAARILYSRALMDGKLMPSEQQTVREQLTKVNEDLVFSTKVTKEDPYVDSYAVKGGDSLVKINQRNNLGPDWRLLQRINRMSDPGRLREGQKLKLVKGPFHVIVHKSAYRMDLFMGPADKQNEWLYIRSFTVGLGEGNSTPVGSFAIRRGAKLVNPYWVNPRTGERFDADDPKNPIGEFWIGLEGVGESISATGYGLHGTVDPDSIGKQKSMGCVRLGNEDIAFLYELLGEGCSTVKIEAQ